MVKELKHSVRAASRGVCDYPAEGQKFHALNCDDLAALFVAGILLTDEVKACILQHQPIY